MERDWLMRASEDQACRSVRLWQHGLFDHMPSEIAHGILACARDDEGWMILMEDLEATLVPYSRFSVRTNQFFLDAMAALHATFFESPKLSDQTIGLCEIKHVYSTFSPLVGQRESGSSEEIPKKILEGWDLVYSMVDPDITEVIQKIHDDPKILCDALDRYPKTLVHGDLRHANLGLLRGKRTRVVILDWQLTSAAPPAVDLGRYLGTNSALLPVPKRVAIIYHRNRLAYRLGKQFDPGWWRPQLELCLLGGFVQDGWAIALKATHWNVGEGARRRWRADLGWWSERVRAGVKWL